MLKTVYWYRHAYSQRCAYIRLLHYCLTLRYMHHTCIQEIWLRWWQFTVDYTYITMCCLIIALKYDALHYSTCIIQCFASDRLLHGTKNSLWRLLFVELWHFCVYVLSRPINSVLCWQLFWRLSLICRMCVCYPLMIWFLHLNMSLECDACNPYISRKWGLLWQDYCRMRN